jgi:hypothetical protein
MARDDSLLDQTINYAQASGWLVSHFRPARTDKGWRTSITGDKGMPDLILAHPARGVRFWEIKPDTGYPSADQVVWLGTLALSAVVKPADWDFIAAVLRGAEQGEGGALYAHGGVWEGRMAGWATKKYGPPRTALKWSLVR